VDSSSACQLARYLSTLAMGGWRRQIVEAWRLTVEVQSRSEARCPLCSAKIPRTGLAHHLRDASERPCSCHSWSPARWPKRTCPVGFWALWYLPSLLWAEWSCHLRIEGSGTGRQPVGAGRHRPPWSALGERPPPEEQERWQCIALPKAPSALDPRPKHAIN